MDLSNLSTIEIAAISSAGVAVILIIIVITHLIIKRLRRASSSSSRSHHLPSSSSHARSHTRSHRSGSRSRRSPPDIENRGTFTTWGFGVPSGLPSSDNYPPIAPSPSTGQTTLVTPISSTNSQTKLKKGLFGREIKVKIVKDGSQSSHSTNRSLVPKVDIRSPLVLRPKSEELIVVTYEEGLAKLGIVGDRTRAHHILSMSDEPPSFEIARQAYPVASPRFNQGRRQVAGAAVGGDVGLNSGEERRRSSTDRDRDRFRERMNGDRRNNFDVERGTSPDVEERNDRIRNWVQHPQLSPANLQNQHNHQNITPVSATTQPGFAGLGAGHTRKTKAREGRKAAPPRDKDQSVGKAQSTWLPSYYHTPDQPARELDEIGEESGLQYRRGDGSGMTYGAGEGGRDAGEAEDSPKSQSTRERDRWVGNRI